MCWGRRDVRDQRVEFVIRANRGEPLSALCREFEISRPTGYLWLRRFEAAGVSGVTELSRRPHVSPRQTPGEIEARIVALRWERPDWGARKLAVLLQSEGIRLPAITVHRVLLRYGLVWDREGRQLATKRFEREAPNQLWQMDFKGHKGSAKEANTGPLSILDDHSRYLIALEQTGSTGYGPVRERLETVFGSYGVPEEMLMDHGNPWFNTKDPGGWSRLQVWLMRQGISCHWSGVRHPQTQGKVERFHGSLERARWRVDGDLWLSQKWLNHFRYEYNEVRPHEALGMRTPASVWKPSERAYNPNPPLWDYGPGADLKIVNQHGDIWVGKRAWALSRALAKETVQLQHVEQRILVYFCKTLVREIDLSGPGSTAVDPGPELPEL